MSRTLDNLARDIHDALATEPGPSGREKARLLVQEALVDAEFLAEHLADQAPQRHVLHEDSELGFLILGHVIHAPKGSQPHDHGPTWAIYGQAAGESLMDHWEIVTPAMPEARGTVRLIETHRLQPGSAFVYNEGDIHSPRAGAPVKLLRIEGGQIPSRLVYVPVCAAD